MYSLMYWGMSKFTTRPKLGRSAHDGEGAQFSSRHGGGGGVASGHTPAVSRTYGGVRGQQRALGHGAIKAHRV